MKLPKEEKAKYEVQKMIDSSEVETHTSEGWTVLESFEVERSEACPEEISPPYPLHIHCEGVDRYEMEEAIKNAVRTHSGEHQLRFEKVKCIEFLVGKTKDSVLGERKKEIEALEHRLKEADANHKELVGKYDEKAEEAKRRLGETERALVDHANASKERNDMRDRARKLEGDIGKIRKAIGENQMADILSDAEK